MSEVRELEVNIRDVDHFYSIVSILNKMLGHGKDKWTMRGRPLRAIRYASGRKDTTVTILIPEGTESLIATELKLLV